MADEVVITGLVETQRMLVEMPGEVTRNGMGRALVAGSGVIEKGLVDRAPRREEEPAGAREFAPLHESVVTEVHVNAQARFGHASTGFGKSGAVADWEEYGHRIVTHEGADTGKLTEPNPFMRRTVDQDAEKAIDAFCDALLGSVEERYGS